MFLCSLLKFHWFGVLLFSLFVCFFPPVILRWKCQRRWVVKIWSEKNFRIPGAVRWFRDHLVLLVLEGMDMDLSFHVTVFRCCRFILYEVWERMFREEHPIKLEWYREELRADTEHYLDRNGSCKSPVDGKVGILNLLVWIVTRFSCFCRRETWDLNYDLLQGDFRRQNVFQNRFHTYSK